MTPTPASRRTCPQPRRPYWPACALLLLGLSALTTSVSADIAKFDIAGKIYTKHLTSNDDSQGLVWLGNPFWPDPVAGGNGVGSEFELTFLGRVSDSVAAGAKITSRFGERWQDYWESGDRRYGGEINTSGDSVGMNRASYMKLRGAWIRVQPGIANIDWLHIGGSDLGYFNPWTIGRLRYIDRDNGRGYFLRGHLGETQDIRWLVSAIAMPKLWVGPWWSTGLGDPKLDNPFWSRDWAYAGSLDWRASEGTSLRLVASLTRDLEVDTADPDALGSVNPGCTDKLGQRIPGCSSDHAVDLYTRYGTANATLELRQEIGEVSRFDALLAWSSQRMDTDLTGNGVALNQGISPAVYKNTDDFAVTARLTSDDLWDVGLSLKAEYFRIGENYNAIFGARREADVLLTEGLLGGGQLPTLNLANEFIDWDESWVESIIGWHGGTGVATWENEDGDLKIEAEYTYITYTTNAQGRDTDNVYPDFLHSDGYTDIGLYDYANVGDRGRDPRSVYRRNQWRRTHIAVLRGSKEFEIGRGVTLSWKAKFILDQDYRCLPKSGPSDPCAGRGLDDDYEGKILTGKLKLGAVVADGLKIAVGTRVDRWVEQNRRGTLELGYGDDTTERGSGFVQASYYFRGLRAGYHLEYVRKVQRREREADQRFDIWRSKATVEVAW